MSDVGDGDTAKVFICYARKDKDFCNELRATLDIIQWEARPSFKVWHDDDVEVGADWPDELQRKLFEADIFVVLLSMWLVQSEFIRHIEFPVISERRSKGLASVIIVPITRLELGTTPLATIQHALHKPLSEYSRRADAWQIVTRAVLRASAQHSQQKAMPRLLLGDLVLGTDNTATDDTAKVIPLRRKRHEARTGTHPDGSRLLEEVLASVQPMPRQSDPGWSSFQMRVGSAARFLQKAITSAQLSPWAHEQALILHSALNILCSPNSEPSARNQALQAAREAALALEASSES